MKKFNSDCLFYYGTQTPCITKCKSLKNTHVILQSYHPLVHQGMFQDFFPTCQRFLYLNVSNIHRNELRKYDINLKNSKYNSEWDTYSLDLSLPSTSELILEKAKSLLELEGVEGIFLDDLDFWCDSPYLRRSLIDLLENIRKTVSKDVKYIINRGFPLWSKIDGLEAIVLENIYPEKIYTSQDSDLGWFENLISLNFSLMNFEKNEVPIFGLKYSGNDDDVEFDKDFENGERRDFIFKEMNKNIIKTLKYDRSFNQWPKQLIF